MELSNYQLLFLYEAQELLQQLNNQLVAMERSSDDDELIHEIFRAAHSFKGMASTMGLIPLAELTHGMESLLAGMRDFGTEPTPAVIDLLLRALDGLEHMVDEISLTGASHFEVAALVAELEEAARPYERPRPTIEEEYIRKDVPICEVAGRLLAVEVTLDPTCFMKSVRALMTISSLEMHGRVLDITPSLEELEWAEDSTHFGVTLASNAEIAAIEADLALLTEIAHFTVSEVALVPVVTELERMIAPSDPSAPPMVIRPAPTVRVPVERLDALMGLLSELADDRGQLLALAGRQGDPALQALAVHLGDVAERLQREVTHLRLVTLESVFNRFPRLVRDLARELGKEATLQTIGGATEIDRVVADELSDPLIHLIRNALDHGLESSEERLQMGKRTPGVVRLSAHAEGHAVLIEVEDDGRGLDTERLRQAAVRRGLLSAEQAAALTEAEALDLIFAPGLTTAEKATSVSGRGVGMDAVRQKVIALGGTIAVATQSGKGTRFSLQLPLSMAMIEAVLVEVGQEVYGVPASAVEEVLGALPADHDWRGTALPVVHLRERLEVPDGPRLDPAGALVARMGEQHTWLLADRVLGRHEIAVKPLARVLGSTTAVSGAATLADGRVALMLDPGAL